QERPTFRVNHYITKALRSAASRIGSAGRARYHSGARSAGIAGAIRPVGIDVERPSGTLDDFSGDHDLLDAFEARQIEHGVEQNGLHDRAQTPRAGLTIYGLARNRRKRLIGQRQVDRLHFEHALVLLHQRILRLGEDALEGGLVEILQCRDDGKPADEFRDEAVLQQILGLDLAEDFALLAILRRQHLGGEADRGRTAPRGDDLFEAGEGAAADEQDVRRVDLEEFLLRMLAAALRRHARDRALHDLEQRLLHALARHVAGNRGVVGLARYLVDFVDIDDAALRALDIVVRGLQQLQNDVLDVLADVARFGQRRRVGHGEGHVEDARQRLRQEGLARPGRPDQQDIRLRQFDVVVLALVIEPLVVIVDSDREHFLGVV